MAWRIFGMPRLAEYRWLRGLWAASASFSTATSGEGRSGLPNPRSMTSRPCRRASAFRSLMVANTYGGRPLIRRNSMDQVTATPRRRGTRAGPSTTPVRGGGSPAGLGRGAPHRLGHLGDHLERVGPGANGPGGTGPCHLGEPLRDLRHCLPHRPSPGDLHADGGQFCHPERITLPQVDGHPDVPGQPHRLRPVSYTHL